MSFILSSNMNLPVPIVGQEAGPQYAIDVNNCFTLLDSHDHSPGRGVPITPSGLNITSSLDIQSNFLTSVGGVTLSALGSPPANNTIYESGVDLFFTDGIGNNIQITQNGGIAGSPGSISNLTPPASVSYVAGSKTFVFQSDANIAANIDGASLLLRNITPNSTNSVTLSPVSSLSSSYTLTLPTIPGTQSFLTVDNSGNIVAATPFPLTDAGIANSTITNDKFASGTQIPIPSTTVTTTYTVQPTDGLVKANSTSGPFTITLYSAAANPGLTVIIKKISSDLNIVTLATFGSETIDGVVGSKIATQNESLELESDGANWQVKARTIPQFTTSMTNIFSATTTNPTKGTASLDRFVVTRFGSYALVQMDYAQTAAGLSGSGNYRIQFMSGLTIDTTRVNASATNGSVVANTVIGDDVAGLSNVTKIGSVYVVDSTRFAVKLVLSALENQPHAFTFWDSSTATSSSQLPFSVTTLFVSFTAMIPVTEWNY